jgi:hypothetical protein
MTTIKDMLDTMTARAKELRKANREMKKKLKRVK